MGRNHDLHVDSEIESNKPKHGHTATPWTYHSGCVYQDGPNVFPKGNEDGIPIARMDREPGNGTSPAERDQNAKFIVRAVNCHDELIAACEGLLYAFAPWANYDKPEDLHSSVRRAHDAIVKAKAEL